MRVGAIDHRDGDHSDYRGHDQTELEVAAAAVRDVSAESRADTDDCRGKQPVVDDQCSDQPEREQDQGLPWDLGQELADAVRPDANADDAENDAPDSHQSTSMVASHLVLNTPARFGAISRNG